MTEREQNILAKESKAYELKEEARKLELEASQERQELEIKQEQEYRKNTKTDVYCSDDYAGLEAGKYSFYFGYEMTICPVKSHKEDCEDNGCEKREWCFVASINKKEVMRIPASKLYPKKQEEPMFFLLAGIGIFLKRKNNE